MKRLLALALFLTMVSSCCFAQLPPEQKLADFMSLAALYDKNYGPYEWKIKAFGYDLLQLTDWIAQVNASTDDLSFYDICVRYVASLHDFHDEFVLPSSYEAFLPISVDIYDGKVLVDGIDRSSLDPTAYPFADGDEVVSIDGTAVADLITALGPYAVNGQGNPVSRNRLAAAMMVDRFQGWYTYASQIKPGDSATVVIKSNGKAATYKITWQNFGIALNSEGPVPDPVTSAALQAPGREDERQVRRTIREQAKANRNAWHAWTGAPAPRQVRSVPSYRNLLDRLHRFSYLKASHAVAGSIEPFGSPFPVFDPPAGFQLRLGGDPTDEFLSGTFPVGKYTIGFIRIPSFEPLSDTHALDQFQAETTFFQQNTDGLVIDLMSNGGGDGCYSNNLLQYLFSKSFHSIGLELRATEFWLQVFESSLIDAQFAGDQTAIKLYSAYIGQIQKALAAKRGLTGALPVCTDSFTYTPARDDKGKIVAFTKPIVLLTDNFTGSAAEFFSATLQDLGRAAVYGVRTSGGGGNVVEFDFNATPFSEGSARVTLSLGIRNHGITTPDLPTAPLIENIGIVPNVVADYQTADNLLHAGQTFVKGFSNAISSLIATGKP